MFMRECKIQLILTGKANEIVSIFKIKNDLKTKQEAVNIILERHGELI